MPIARLFSDIILCSLFWLFAKLESVSSAKQCVKACLIDLNLRISRDLNARTTHWVFMSLQSSFMRFQLVIMMLKKVHTSLEEDQRSGPSLGLRNISVPALLVLMPRSVVFLDKLDRRSQQRRMSASQGGNEGVSNRSRTS